MSWCRFARWAVLFCFPLTAIGQAQNTPESYSIYTSRPRLLLRPARLRLLRREVQRSSPRWEQFHTVIAAGLPVPEPGFATALYYRVADDEKSGRRAIEWALSPGSDLRQVALVYDWCHDLLSANERSTLANRLRASLDKPVGESLSDLRSRLFAAIALGDDEAAAAEAAVREAIERQWRARIVSALKSGSPVIHADDTYPLLEILHATRDNLNVDLRQDFPAYFKQLPLFDLLSYYPAPFPASENEFRIPFSPRVGEPDLQAAALSRAGELAMVAFDTNAPETQVLQGWLMNDHFLMRGPFGITYEFLWANPYQPGLSYYHVPLVLHDEIFGRLLVRSSWDDDATWAGYIDGALQEFKDGRVIPLDPRAKRAPLDLEEAMIYFDPPNGKLEAGKRAANDIFVVGLPAKTEYHVEIDDEGMFEAGSATGGILYLKGLRPGISVRFNPRSEPPGTVDHSSAVAQRPDRAPATQ